MNRERAETIAIQAVSFLAEDPERMSRFMVATGLTQEDFVSRAFETDMLVSVLDVVAADDPAMMAFVASADVAPEDVLRARVVLGGTYDVST
ncbi:MAG: DUF3572 domain-containing protein [Pseudomonadota bacterium]